MTICNRRNFVVLATLVIFNIFGGALQAGEPTTMPSGTASPQTIRYVLFLIVVLVGIFLVSSFAFLRWSRRFRSHIFHEPSSPTPAEDAWAMHQLPPDSESERAPEPDQDDQEA